jgi:hypothetical protein
MRRRSASRTGLAALALAVMAATATAPAQAGERDRPTCKRPHTRTLAHNRVARVFETRPARASYDSRLFGCLRSVGKAIRLDEASDDGYVSSSAYDHVRLAGRFVAWSTSYYDISCKADCPPGYDPSTDWVNVYNLRNNQTRSIALESPPTAVAVARFGAIAWTEGTGDQVELSVRDRAGTRQVAQGAIDTTSIAIAGGTLIWRQDGRRRSEPLSR